MAIQSPEGTRDLLPDEAKFWAHFKAVAADIFGRYGYLPIETPLFEQTELFVRGIGEATDVVSKEMFTAISGQNLQTLLDGGSIKAKSRLSLRPEGTAGVVRAVVQHDLVPQGAAAGEAHVRGPDVPRRAPAEGPPAPVQPGGRRVPGRGGAAAWTPRCIIMLMRFYAAIGIPVESTRLLVNSMGCEACRPAYREAVRAFMAEHAGELCEECNRRAEINPLRAFDCKNPGCAAVMEGAPKITDHLCDDCRAHYEAVKAYLDGAGLAYVEDPKLVRGLDYYTRTVFEVQVTEGMGSQNAIGGGGRYDKLAQEVGGRPTPGFGWALGYERCVLALEAAGRAFPPAARCDFFVACVDDSVRAEAFSLVQAMRDAGFAGEMDHQHRSLKSQFKLADKLDAAQVAVLGPDELAEGKVKVRNMQTHEERLADLAATKALLARLSAEPQGFEPPSIDEVFGA